MGCAIDGSGDVRCWGTGAGAGSTTTLQSPGSRVALPANAMSVAAGSDFTCAALSTGEVWCWGDNPYGELGVDPAIVSSTLTPVRATGIDNAVSMAAGPYAACAVLSDGTAACWGANVRGVLGDGSTTDRWTPLVIPALTDVTQISLYVSHACARRSDGTLRCWGANDYGVLGDGTTTDTLFATAVPMMAAAAVQVSVGYYHSCALDATGDVWCWGRDTDGSLGQAGSSATSLVPRRVDW